MTNEELLTIKNFISKLRDNWKPKKETKTGYGYHGSKKGDEIKYTVYFDEYRTEWTTEDRAFEGLVFKEISNLLR